MRRIGKVLIANRGEIACRIARTCRRLGLRIATIHSSADRAAKHVREIGESIEVGTASSAQSYLNIDAVIEAARRVGADAIHPGYGFLSENAAFARAVEAAGLIFIGPEAATIERLGGKASAKQEAVKIGLPVVPGSDGASGDPRALATLVRGMKLPVLLKAVAGGGGRGMALIESLDNLESRIESAMREAAQAFGNGELIIEQYLPRVRHIEVQIAGDGRGGAIHLFERECSLQRRHQKVIEEAPAPDLPAALRAAMTEGACRLAAAVKFRGLGTVEFIVAGDAYFFLEVNPRLQVEHPVTEAVTGLDLVEMQLRIADEERLPVTQDAVQSRGHAIEARLYAEDAAAGFLPATGRIAVADFPATGVRVDSGVDAGDEISPYYDPMIAKLVTHADTRRAALAALLSALRRTTVIGLTTNLAFLEQLLSLDEVRRGCCHTRLIDEHWNGGADGRHPPPIEHLCAAALLWLMQERAGGDLGCWSEWRGFTGWRLGTGEDNAAPSPALILKSQQRQWPIRFSALRPDGTQQVVCGEQARASALRPLGNSRYLLQCGERTLELALVREQQHIQIKSPLGADAIECTPYLADAAGGDEGLGQLTAPMVGKVVAVNVAEGERVTAGQIVIVLESMKMELRVPAPGAGVIRGLRCRVGDMVERGALLAEVAAAANGDAA